MKEPEYWEDEEKWLDYEEWQKANPEPEPEPLSPLRLAVAKARGDTLSAKDIEDRINFENRLWELLKARMLAIELLKEEKGPAPGGRFGDGDYI